MSKNAVMRLRKRRVPIGFENFTTIVGSPRSSGTIHGQARNIPAAGARPWGLNILDMAREGVRLRLRRQTTPKAAGGNHLRFPPRFPPGAWGEPAIFQLSGRVPKRSRWPCSSPRRALKFPFILNKERKGLVVDRHQTTLGLIQEAARAASRGIDRVAVAVRIRFLFVFFEKRRTVF